MTTMTLEGILASPDAFDVPISALQTAIARVASHVPLAGVLDDETCVKHFGCDAATLDALDQAPRIVGIIAGVRGGKSLIAAAAAVTCALTADLSAMKEHELARAAIVAPTKDNAQATFNLLVGHVRASAELSKCIVGEPTQTTLVLQREDGRKVEIVVVAASHGAVTLRSRWLVCAVLDEACLFGAEAENAAVNAEELLRAAEPRLVPGGQVWVISSPFGPSGLLHDLWQAHFGKPGHVLVVHAPTRALNPSYPQATIDAVRARTPDVASREFDASWLDPASAFFDSFLVHGATRAEPLEELPIAGARYCAAMDPATRGNAWTLAIARTDGVRVFISVARQWIGSKTKPLDPEEVFAEAAPLLRRFGVTRVMTDQWSIDALKAIARRYGIELEERPAAGGEKTARYESTKMLIGSRKLELPPLRALVDDLIAVKKIATGNGVRIELPKTPDGRHCDFAPVVALVCAHEAEFVAAGAGKAPAGTLQLVRGPFTTSHAPHMIANGGRGFAWSGNHREQDSNPFGKTAEEYYAKNPGPPPTAEDVARFVAGKPPVSADAVMQRRPVDPTGPMTMSEADFQRARGGWR